MKRSTIIIYSTLIILMVISLFMGRYGASVFETTSALLRDYQSPLSKIMLNIRLPRILFACVAGMALALSGAIFQTIFKNPLASGDVIGASSWCSLFAAVAIIMFNNKYMIILMAFFGGLISILIMVKVGSLLKGNRILNFVIIGIVSQAIASALMMMVKLVADPYQQLGRIEYWLMGGFSDITWDQTFVLCLITLIVTVIVYLLRWKIMLLAYGDELDTLGVDSHRLLYFILILATILVSVVVSMAGIVGWIGLLVPHMNNLIFGKKFDQNLIKLCGIGAIFCLVADDVSRLMFAMELPISIVTSLFGAIFLIGLLVKGKIQI